MATLSSLPFNVHVLIVRNLNLKDALSYSQILPLSHDAVYYVFSHRKELDFSSTLSDGGIISLADHTLLQTLHAHTRATQIRYFSVSANFRALHHLKFYLDLYWTYTFLPIYDDNLQSSLLSGEFIGHPAGQLKRIGYLHTFNNKVVQSNPSVLQLLLKYEDHIFGVSIEIEPLSPSMLSDESNWSTVDIDRPYTKCINCDDLIINPALISLQICPLCSHH